MLSRRVFIGAAGAAVAVGGIGVAAVGPKTVRSDGTRAAVAGEVSRGDSEVLADADDPA
jgi:hypothetical protein